VLPLRDLADRQHNTANLAKQAVDCNCVLRAERQRSEQQEGLWAGHAGLTGGTRAGT
jgi:hypothetical protein